MTVGTLPGGPIATVSGLWSRRSSGDTAVTGLVFLYWLVFENVLFFYPADFGGTGLLLMTNLIKLGLPFALIAYTGLPSWNVLTRGPVALYLFFFAAFLAWALVPTLLGGDPATWLKILPRVLYFVSVVALFSRRPAAFVLFAKCLVVYVLLAFVQYVLLYLTAGWGRSIATPNGSMAGPFGLLGTVTTMMQFPGMPLPFVRLTGFWNEPSNAAGSSYAAYFLARFLTDIGESPRWRRVSVLCLLTGLATFSNAGYLALGTALLAGLLMGPGQLLGWRAVRIAVLLPVATAMLVVVLGGRRYVAERMPDNVWARAITGVRDTESALIDPTDGRLDLLLSATRDAGTTMIGVGIQTVGTGGIDVSASAPIYWMVLTGIPGLILVLAREAVLLAYARSLMRRVPAMLALVQVLVVVMVQQSVYGSWMNPNYFVLSAAVLTFSVREHRRRIASATAMPTS